MGRAARRVVRHKKWGVRRRKSALRSDTGRRSTHTRLTTCWRMLTVVATTATMGASVNEFEKYAMYL